MNDIQLAQTGAGDYPEKVRALQYEYDQMEMSLGDVENEIIQSRSAVDAYTKAIAEDEAELAGFIRKDSGLYLTEGAEYGACGKQFIRLNAACPRERLKDGLERLAKSVSAWEALEKRDFM